MANDFLLYGANGYVGQAVAELAVSTGLRPLLAGRNGAAVAELADRLGVDGTGLTLDDADGLDRAMADVPVVVNCAGPFVNTYRPVMDACIRTGTHYLDITGEPQVFGGAARRHAAAVERQVMLLPAAGFDVVPTDCLAAHLVGRLPGATHLALAFRTVGPSRLPPGTAATLIGSIPQGSNKLHRVDGKVVAGKRRPSREIDFGSGAVTASLMTWGDVFTAYHSTSIPNIDVYVGFPPAMFKQLDMLERLRPLFRLGAMRRLALRQVPTGATAEQRARTTTDVWGEVTDGDGNRAVSLLHGPEAGLDWTARAVLRVARRVLAGDFVPGYQTPATAYGSDLVLEVDGVIRQDVA